MATSRKYKVRKTYFGLEENTTRGLIATWSFDDLSHDDEITSVSPDYIEHYKVIWKRRVKLSGSDADGQNTIFEIAHEDTTNELRSSFHADQDDTCIKVFIYPISKTKDNGTKYWNDNDYVTSEKDWTMEFSPIPDKPNTPALDIEDDKLVITFESLSTETMNSIEYQIIEDHDESKPFEQKPFAIRNTYHSIKTKKVNPGRTYKARCRGINGNAVGEWTDFCTPVTSRPEVPIITEIKAFESKSVRISFESSTKADSYNIEWIAESDAKTIPYETLTQLFDQSNVNKGSTSVQHDELTSNSSDDQSQETLIFFLTAENSSLQQGGKYFIRIKASKSGSDDPSKGSETSDKSLKYFIIGTEPKAPTTWSSVSTAILGDVGDYINLYWSHNSEDQSILSSSILELNLNGEAVEYLIGSDAFENEYFIVEKYDYEKNSTRVCKLKTSALEVGYDIKWRVRTAGAAIYTEAGKDKVTGEDVNVGDLIYGEWSVERTIKAYAEPSYIMHITNESLESLPTIPGEIYNDQPIYMMSGFPLTVEMVVGQALNHHPISYTVNILPLVETAYRTVNAVGNVLVVDAKTKIYSKYIIADGEQDMLHDIGPNDVNLYNNMTYQITSSVTMSSGITINDTKYFRVGWEEELFTPSADVEINRTNLTAEIRPFINEDDEDIIFAVYRREYDGKYTEIESNIKGNNRWVTDPHPALNYVRYRIVARHSKTGSIGYCDTVPESLGEHGVVIQWDEPWQTYDGTVTNPNESMLKLYYNITKSFSNDVDVSLVNYMGREHPVSYYGTHKGEKMSWGVEIDKTDKETLYAIRRLSIWAGDVYVREPSGVGYWANIKVSYNEDYNSLVVPISFDITRVEGGM